MLVAKLEPVDGRLVHVTGTADFGNRRCAAVARERANCGAVGNQVLEVFPEEGKGQRTDLIEVPFRRQVITPGLDRLQEPVTRLDSKQRTRLERTGVTQGVGIVEDHTARRVSGKVRSRNALGRRKPNQQIVGYLHLEVQAGQHVIVLDVGIVEGIILFHHFGHCCNGIVAFKID